MPNGHHCRMDFMFPPEIRVTGVCLDEVESATDQSEQHVVNTMVALLRRVADLIEREEVFSGSVTDQHGRHVGSWGFRP